MKTYNLFLFGLIIAARGADYSGHYKGTLESSTGGSSPGITATIRQLGGAVTGTIGPGPTQQTPLLEGKIEGGELVFRISELGGQHFRLQMAGDTLAGTVSPREGAKVRFDRVTLVRIGSLVIADLVPPLPNEGSFRSEVIAKLRQSMASNSEALRDFWEKVKSSGAPLVEPDPTDERFQLVTFLWQGSPDHKSVSVLWLPFATSRPADYLMVNIPNTDLWFKTVRIPRGARLQYRLSPNDPLAVIPPSASSRVAVTDPLNPTGTLLEAPGALPQPFYARREHVERFAHQEHTLKSQNLSQERKIVVYTPPGYNSVGKPYPTVYMFDGEDRDGLVFASSTFENLVADKKIPPTLIVRIENPNRPSRMMLNGDERFYRFLALELVPFIRGRYHASANPEDNAVCGYSLGGFAAVYAGLRHSALFGLVLCQSGSLYLNPERADALEATWIAQQFIESSRLPLRFYLDAGMFEVDLSGQGGNVLIPSRHLRDVLRAKGYEVTYQEFPGGHDSINWRGTMADGLIALLGTSPYRGGNVVVAPAGTKAVK